MGQTVKAPRENRTITVDFQDPSTYFQLISDGKGEQGDAGGYAATGISSTSRSMYRYQRLKMATSSPFSVRTRVCNNKCAPSFDHGICCFLQKRLLTTSFTVDSTNPVAIGSPLRYLSPSFGITCRLFTTYVRNAENALTNGGKRA